MALIFRGELSASGIDLTDGASNINPPRLHFTEVVTQAQQDRAGIGLSPLRKKCEKSPLSRSNY